jgi:hypothetical protein
LISVVTRMVARESDYTRRSIKRKQLKVDPLHTLYE